MCQLYRHTLSPIVGYVGSCTSYYTNSILCDFVAEVVVDLSCANCSHPLCLCSPNSEIDSSPLKGCEGNCGPGGK